MKQYSSLFFLIIILILALFMIIHPEATVEAAAEGLKLWSKVVLPALLPFFIVAELMFSLGLVYILGMFLEPIMQPLFRLPGCSSLVVAMGFTSGFPVGALLSRKLYDEKLLTAEETERLTSFTNNSSPLFILGAVGIGMFASREIGYLLALSHYAANFLVGILWKTKAPIRIKRNREKAREQTAARVLLQDKWLNLDIGSVLSEAIKNSVNNILAIGGFILIFSVITRMLTWWGVMGLLAKIIQNLLFFVDVSWQCAYGTAMGIFEMTIGIQTVAAAPAAGLSAQLAATSLVLAFSGLSVIAQIMGIFAGTPIRLSFYLLSRLMQMVFSCIITLLGYKFWLSRQGILPAITMDSYKILYSFDALSIVSYSILGSFILLIILVIMAIIIKD
ncbi:MAG: sporulation integral membrane protein YlbJ [Syntrophomonadaceae bacterium]|jgi:sporulation integral membrane protein YlbJ|nr:sporulation integral membrane protein YlbJ [Syntrophomonadaceae bacterium]